MNIGVDQALTNLSANSGKSASGIDTCVIMASYSWLLKY